MITLNAGAGSTVGMILVYVVFLGALMYFMAIRPQKKQQKKMDELIASLEIGDYVLTTSGFYGSIIDITDDTVIVEFGNNKNCRIPMQKSAITPTGSTSETTYSRKNERDSIFKFFPARICSDLFRLCKKSAGKNFHNRLSPRNRPCS